MRWTKTAVALATTAIWTTGVAVLWGVAGLNRRCAAAEPICVFDLSRLQQTPLTDPAAARRAWDEAHFVFSLQGIVNRKQPRLFVRYLLNPDDFWWNYLRGESGWLTGRTVETLDSLDAVIARFGGELGGLVVYDQRVAATSNLASTIAGVEDRACVRYDAAPDSLWRKLEKTPPAKDVLRLFRSDGSPLFTGRGEIPDVGLPSTGSAKCDAYLWAIHRFVKTKRCGGTDLAYYIDAYWLAKPELSSPANNTLCNHDFFIARRAFFFDLGMWPDEIPVDDPKQKPGGDVAVLRRLLRATCDNAGGKVFSVGGFVPWLWKYVDYGQAGGKRHPVHGEWEMVRLFSAYNAIVDADALGYSAMANASFYQHFPLAERYPQHPRPTIESLRNGGAIDAGGRVAPRCYATFYMGDYDAAAWLHTMVPGLWNDPKRGKVACNWAFNPNLDRRAPHAMHYVRTHASPTDWFIAGDCGAGYLNPGMLAAPRLDPAVADGWDAWVEHNGRYFRRYDLSITGFVIDGFAPDMGDRGLAQYARFSPDGVGRHTQRYPQGLAAGTMPHLSHISDIDGSPADAAREMVKYVSKTGPQFLMFRTILKSPTWHADAIHQAEKAAPQRRLQFVDAPTFFLLLKTHEAGKGK